MPRRADHDQVQRIEQHRYDAVQLGPGSGTRATRPRSTPIAAVASSPRSGSPTTAAHEPWESGPPGVIGAGSRRPVPRPRPGSRAGAPPRGRALPVARRPEAPVRRPGPVPGHVRVAGEVLHSRAECSEHLFAFQLGLWHPDGTFQTFVNAYVAVLLRSCYARDPSGELRNDVSAVLRRVEAGEHLTVTVSGRRVAELVPLAPGPVHRLECLHSRK